MKKVILIINESSSFWAFLIYFSEAFLITIVKIMHLYNVYIQPGRKYLIVSDGRRQGKESSRDKGVHWNS